MATCTEAPCTPNHSKNKNKDLDGKLSRSDVSSDDENDAYQMTISSTRKRQRRINSDDEDEIDRTPGLNTSKEHGTAFSRVKKNLNENFGQNKVEDKNTKTTDSSDSEGDSISNESDSDKNKRRSARKRNTKTTDSSDSEGDSISFESDSDKNKRRSARKRNTKTTDSSDSEGDSISNESDSDKNKRRSARKRNTKTTDSSDSEGDSISNESDSDKNKRRSARKSACGNVWPLDGNNCTDSAKKAKIRKQEALESLRKKREGLSDKTSLDDEYNNEGSLLPKEEEEEVGDEEESGSDMDNFIVEDSQSQELHVFAKPDLDESYKRLVQMLLRSILDNDFLSSLHDEDVLYFDEAKDAIEKVIESRKNLVGSTTWNQFKESLEKCSIFKSEAIEPMISAAKCQACRKEPRNLTEHITFDSADWSEVNEPPSKMEFSVGCFCAERGSLYHDLHHHCSHLKQSCIDKINKVRETMGTASDVDIVECCIDDEEWLNLLFKTFEALVNAADEWAEDGVKRKHMKAYCSSFS